MSQACLQGVSSAFVTGVLAVTMVSATWPVIGAVRPAPHRVAAGSASASHFRGWKTRRMTNGLVEVQALPQIGGRIIEYRLGSHNFLFVNPVLAGKLPPASGLGPGKSWLNYGGEKLWPAPQGWKGPNQWPGPPDPVLDAGAYTVNHASGDSVTMTSRSDPFTGIRFIKHVQIYPNSTRVGFTVTMQNISQKPRRWGIWSVTQLDCTLKDSKKPDDLRVFIPLDGASHYPAGYRLIFGAKDNPSFKPDLAHHMMQVKYCYQVGKIGMDSRAGWVAAVDPRTGDAFVQRFTFVPGKEYPDGCSVEEWCDGVGSIVAYKTKSTSAYDPVGNPFLLESELLSPFASLRPGQSYTWHYDWYCAALGSGQTKVVDCTDAGVVAHRLTARKAGRAVTLAGRFGAFVPGTLQAQFKNARGRLLLVRRLAGNISPLRPVTLAQTLAAPAGVKEVSVVLRDRAGRLVGSLGMAVVK
jgi:hypothetical protein